MILGLRIFIIGMSVTFVALALLLLLMRLLLRVFPAKEPAAPMPAAKADSSADEPPPEEVAAALAVGICLLERSGGLLPRDPQLGATLESRR